MRLFLYWAFGFGTGVGLCLVFCIRERMAYTGVKQLLAIERNRKPLIPRK
jgi:hypothetical protein